MQDRRRRQRFRVSLPLRVAGGADDEVFYTSTEDVGEYGIAFMLPRALDPGMAVTCILNLSSRKSAGEVSLRCTIARSDAVPAADRKRIAAIVDAYRFLDTARASG